MGKPGGYGRRRSAPLAIAAAMAAAAIAAAAAILVAKAPLRIGFFDVDGDLAASVSKVVDAWAARSGVKTRRSVLARIDAASLRGVDAVFLYPSAANERSAAGFAAISGELGARVSIPLRRTWCLPLLVDSRELDWRKDIFGRDPAAARFDASALAAAAKAAKGKAEIPLILTGGDDAELLDAAGLLALAKGGIAAYGKLVEAARRAGAGAELSAGRGGPDLMSAIETFAELRKDRLLHPDWLSFKPGDAEAFVAEGLAALSLQSLSMRRKVPYEALGRWASSPVLAWDSGRSAATASTLSVAAPSTRKGSKLFGPLAEYLSSQAGQEALQAATGLAPAASSARAADVQASEARIAAGGSTVVQGLSRDAFDSASARAELAAALRRSLLSRVQ